MFSLGGKTQVMGEIKVALKKEVKTEGDQLVLEILQCRNITYKFKSPDHLPGGEPLLCLDFGKTCSVTDPPLFIIDSMSHQICMSSCTW